MLNLEKIIELINQEEELVLPNGAKGAIWKNSLIDNITYYIKQNPDIVYCRDCGTTHESPECQCWDA